MAAIKKNIDLRPYMDLDKLLKMFRSYQRDPVQVGKNHDKYLCSSPFHNADTTPSCRIFQLEDNIWRFKCYSTGYSGDIFRLVMHKQNVEFITAVWIVTQKVAPYKSFAMKNISQLELPFQKLSSCNETGSPF